MKAAGLNALRLGAPWDRWYLHTAVHGLSMAWPGRCHVAWCGTTTRCLQRKLPQHSPRSCGGGQENWVDRLTSHWLHLYFKFRFYDMIMILPENLAVILIQSKRNTMPTTSELERWNIVPGNVCSRILLGGSDLWDLCLGWYAPGQAVTRYRLIGLGFKQESHWESLKVNGKILIWFDLTNKC